MTDKNNQVGLFLTKKGGRPKLIAMGCYASQIVIPNTEWMVCAKALNGWAKPNVIVKINLKTYKETILDISSADYIEPVAYVNNMLFISRDREWYSYDIVTDKIKKLTGELIGLRDVRERSLQETSQHNVFYTVAPNNTIGKLDMNTLKFTPIASYDGLQFGSNDMWVDEKENKVYIAHDGDLIEIPLLQ